VIDRYHERPPAFDPHGLCAQAWTRTSGGTREVRVLPDACMDVIWHRESGSLFVAGPDTEPQVGLLEPGTLVALRFAPGCAPAVLGVPAESLRNDRVALDAIWPPAVTRRLAATLAETTSVDAAHTALEHAITQHAKGSRDHIATGVLRLLAAGTPVALLADTIGLSERQLHRRCLAAFGYGPKVLHRILRFNRALDLARAGVPFADAAQRLGYSDQPHLSREVKALAGVPLGALIG
jgi:AraC-like DNA-binding protein